MSPRMAAGLADDAPEMAIARRCPPEGCVHHSDHGSQCGSLLLERIPISIFARFIALTLTTKPGSS